MTTHNLHCKLCDGIVEGIDSCLPRPVTFVALHYCHLLLYEAGAVVNIRVDT